MSLGLGFYDKMALSQLTSLEKQSLYQLLCAAMVVDGNSWGYFLASCWYCI